MRRQIWELGRLKQYKETIWNDSSDRTVYEWPVTSTKHGGITVLKTSVWTNTVVSQKVGEIESYKALEIGVQKWCKEHIPRNWNNLRWFLDTCLLWIDKTIATGKTYIWSRCDERLKTRVDLITPSKINEFYVLCLVKDQSKIKTFPWARRGSNTGPLDLQSNALPTAPQTLFWLWKPTGGGKVIKLRFYFPDSLGCWCGAPKICIVSDSSRGQVTGA